MIMFSNHFELSFPADIQNLSLVENAIEGLAEQGTIPDTVFGNVMVACTEATLNAIHHGSSDDASKSVKLRVEIQDDELNIYVHDDGDGFDHENLPDPTQPENIEKASGRGIFIIRNLADELEFLENGSSIKMTFSLNVPVVAEA